MNEQPTSYRYRAVLWLTSAAALAYLCRNAVGVAESTIRSDIVLSLDQSGWFMGAFFWSYALLQVPSGWWVQRVGTRVALTVFAVVWAAATLGISVASGFGGLLAAQIVMGAAQAGVFPAACHSIGHWMPLTSRSMACGWLTAGMQVGAIAASGLTGELLQPFGWRAVFVVFAIPSLLWALGFALRFRNQPVEVAQLNAAERELIASPTVGHVKDKSDIDQRAAEHRVTAQRATNRPASLGVHWQARFLILLCGQQVCRAAGYMFFASWFPTFLQETRGVSIVASGYQQALVLSGTLTGSLCGGFVTDWVYCRTGKLQLSRSGVGAFALAGCGLLIFIAFFVADANVAVGLLASGAFFAALAGPCAFATTIDVGGNRVAELFGWMNMTGNLAAAACPVVVARIVGWSENWELALLLFAATYLLGSLCWIGILLNAAD
ncbi:MAG: MFS transporter [Planctomycetales bacterium]|nr:MFS transporter [Planctomycetales bacterium]